MTFTMFGEMTDRALRDELRQMYDLIEENPARAFVWDITPQLARKVRWELNLTKKLSTIATRTDSKKTIIRINAHYLLEKKYKKESN